jgi:quercetin dioxygenase-like cupin family protein
VRFVVHPPGLGEVGWHNPPERQLVIFLTGETKFEASDGAVRRVGPGAVVLAEDTWGKGHVSRHPATRSSA